MADTALIPTQPQPFIRKRLPDTESHHSLAPGQAEALAGIAHDARNLVTALKLCMELIGEPGVLTEPHAHYVEEVRSITRGAEHLLRRLSAVARTSTLAWNSTAVHVPVRDLAAAVHELAGLLAAVAGHTVEVQIACLPCPGALALSEENLTRILLNLVRNAADAMPTGGRIRITAQRGGGRSFLWTLRPGTDDTCGDFDIDAPGKGPQTVVLSVEDDGPGIPADLAERIFAPGFSTRRESQPWPDAPHHGLGLSIVRQLAEEAGGTARLAPGRHRGARFEIELPLTNVTPSLLSAPVAKGGNDAQ
ncbi:MAG TPA: HAMP domain-containing sensor histidine kinase [Acidobacteriaceae bacterium]